MPTNVAHETQCTRADLRETKNTTGTTNLLFNNGLTELRPKQIKFFLHILNQAHRQESLIKSEDTPNTRFYRTLVCYCAVFIVLADDILEMRYVKHIWVEEQLSNPLLVIFNSAHLFLYIMWSHLVLHESVNKLKH